MTLGAGSALGGKTPERESNSHNMTPATGTIIPSRRSVTRSFAVRLGRTGFSRNAANWTIVVFCCVVLIL